MVIPEEREGRMDNDPHLSRDTTPANSTVNTRRGGIEKELVPQKVQLHLTMTFYAQKRS